MTFKAPSNPSFQLNIFRNDVNRLLLLYFSASLSLSPCFTSWFRKSPDSSVAVSGIPGNLIPTNRMWQPAFILFPPFSSLGTWSAMMALRTNLWKLDRNMSFSFWQCYGHLKWWVPPCLWTCSAQSDQMCHFPGKFVFCIFTVLFDQVLDTNHNSDRAE